MQLRSKLAALAGGVAVSLSLAPVAVAEERVCRGTIGASPSTTCACPTAPRAR